MEQAEKLLSERVAQGAERAGASWPSPCELIAAISWFRCGIEGLNELAQRPPAHSVAEMCMDTTTTHRTTPLSFQNKYIFSSPDTIYKRKKILKT